MIRTTTSNRQVRPTRVCVVGLGYIGLPTAAILANRGYDVVGVDIRPDVVAMVNRGQVPIHEPGLGELIEDVVRRGKLVASTSPDEADVFIICVPTPFHPDKSPDLSCVRSAAAAIRPFVRSGNLIILESTSPPMTTRNTVVPIAVPEPLEVGQDVFVAYCPERVLPGRILVEAIQNDRIVGGITEHCTQRTKEFYETFVAGEVVPTTAIAAEVTKLAENAFRDVNIAFANELSMMADQLGADPLEIIQLANRHPRVNILNPGPGVGGHCISVDPWFLAHAAPHQSALIQTARMVNDTKPTFVAHQVRELADQVESPVIGCLGLAYKPDVDDFRESPSVEVVRQLIASQAGEILACDPYVDADHWEELPLTPLSEVLERSNVLVLLTAHQVFRELPIADLDHRHLLDTTGAWRAAIRARQAMPATDAAAPV